MSQGAAVLLDRDGVLNAPQVVAGQPRPPESIDDVRLLPGVEPACRALRAAGLRLICITNQPDIARGTIPRAAVDAINQLLQARLDLDAVIVCPHDDDDGCECRKPKPGMILAAARDFDLDLPRCVVVGDRWRDMEAGRRAGCLTVFVDHDYNEQRPLAFDRSARSLAEAVPWILDAAVRSPAAEPGGMTCST